MQDAIDFEFDDLQALYRFGHGKLTDTCFMLLNIVNAEAAKQWLGTAPVSTAVISDPPPDKALQIAFSVHGLRALGLEESIIDGFSDEFITGMAGDEGRSRRLGDVGSNAPQHWRWGGQTGQVPHLLLLLYATKGGINTFTNTVRGELFSRAFQLLTVLPTLDIGTIEPFGFVDGISQPAIDWAGRQSTDLHERDRYSNWLAAGEVVLGYPNEYGQYTKRPLIDPQQDRFAAELPNAQDVPSLKDFGRNGSYLVIRQLHQDVPGFWQFLDKAAGSVPEKREQLAASMVGRKRDGSPVVPPANEHIPGIPAKDHANHFTYEHDPIGHGCPIGAHIRRANPRTGDYPPGMTGLVSRLISSFGFGLNRPDEDLIASSRFHRLLRRGRSYGPVLSPEDAVKPDAPADERGLQFICLVANISRQFEFIQNAWLMSSKFGGGQQERDPLIGIREPLQNGDVTDTFNRPDPAGPVQKTCHLPQFVTVRGGGYFFMPGLRALKYIAASPVAERGQKS
jgi:deferrochelatase/peroxidase EfeB